jgi:Na+/H+ antiporter NhaD/arsenite permease-like protein
MLDKGLGVVAFLLFVNIVLLLAGNVMEPSSIVLIMAPILFPVAMKLGIDPVHFGIMMVVNMEVGMCHPPVGLNLYCGERHHQDGHHRAHHRVWPWLLTMLVFLVVGDLLAPADARPAATPRHHQVAARRAHRQARRARSGLARRRARIPARAPTAARTSKGPKKW